MTADKAQENRLMRPTPGAGKVYSVGCLPIILAWFLLDLIGKAILWGIASLCGVQIPPLPKVVQAMAWGVLASLGIICIAIFVFWLYLITSDFVHTVFHKGKTDKENGNERNGK